MKNPIENENIKIGLGVFVLIFNKDFSKILLLKRNEEKRKKWNANWGNIGGKFNEREYSIDACLREAKEEINLTILKEKVKLIDIIEAPNFTPKVHAIHFVYATIIDENTPIKINEESEEYKWFKIDSLPEKMLDKKQDILNWRKKAISCFN